MAKKKSNSEIQAKEKAASGLAAAADKIKKDMPAPDAPQLSALELENARTTASGDVDADVPPRSSATPLNSPNAAREKEGAKYEGSPSGRAVRASKSESRKPKKRSKVAYSTGKRDSNAAKTMVENRELLGLSLGQIKQAAEASEVSGVYDNIPGVSNYARRVNRGNRATKTAIVRPSSNTRRADLRLSKTLDQATDAEIAMDALTGGSVGQKAVRDAIADEISWADDGTAMSRRPFTGRGGPGNQMRIRTGKALLDYGVTADQKYFTPTVGEVVKARRIAKATGRAVEAVKENSTQEYNRQRDELVKALESSTHPDDSKAYQEEIAKLDSQQQGKVAVGSATAKETAKSGNLVVRPEGAPDNFVPSGPGTYTNSYNRIRRQTQIPLTQGQFQRIGVAKEAKRKNIEQMMKEAPLGASLGKNQPKALAGTPISLGGARIPHDSVVFNRNKVRSVMSPSDEKEYKSLRAEHNTIVKLGKNITGDQAQRLSEVKESLKRFEADGDTVVSGELKSRRGVTASFDPSIIKTGPSGTVTGRTLLAMATKPGNRPGGYAGVALAGIRDSSASIQENEPLTDKSQKDIYTETRMGRVVKGPSRSNFNAPGLTVNVPMSDKGSGMAPKPRTRSYPVRNMDRSSSDYGKATGERASYPVPSQGSEERRPTSAPAMSYSNVRALRVQGNQLAAAMMTDNMPKASGGYGQMAQSGMQNAMTPAIEEYQAWRSRNKKAEL